MKLWALCQRRRALSQKTLPVFVLILPILPLPAHPVHHDTDRQWPIVDEHGTLGIGCRSWLMVVAHDRGRRPSHLEFFCPPIDLYVNL